MRTRWVWERGWVGGKRGVREGVLVIGEEREGGRCQVWDGNGKRRERERARRESARSPANDDIRVVNGLTSIESFSGGMLEGDVWVERLEFGDEGEETRGGRWVGTSEEGDEGERGEEEEVKMGVP